MWGGEEATTKQTKSIPLIVPTRDVKQPTNNKQQPHSTMPVRNSPTNLRAHPAVLSPAQRSQEPVLATGSYAAGEAMGFPQTT